MSDLIENVSKESLRELLKKVYGYHNVESLKVERKFLSYQPDKGRRIKKSHGDVRVDTMLKFKEVGIDVTYIIHSDGFELIFTKDNVAITDDISVEQAKVTVKRTSWLEALYVASKIILN